MEQSEHRRVLEMLASGKINVDEAERLLRATPGYSEPPEPRGTSASALKYLRVIVTPNPDFHGARREPINIRLPIALLKAGIKFGSILPSKTKDRVGEVLHERGLHLDLNKLDSRSIDELIAALRDTSIDIDDPHAKIRVFCE